MKDKFQLESRLETLAKRKKLYKQYAQDRQTAADWHGMQDAGSDLREIETEISTLLWVLEDS